MTKILLEINEKEIPLNPLMENMLNNLILGYLKCTKKVPKEIKTIKVEIDL
ncbi:MAG: hypothetical protein KGD57_03870 [Candidatus Lokiarchaeota archaeon]|nr:hypothetical protein [Candidatus Lokiarchaeota archaeon]